MISPLTTDPNSQIELLPNKKYAAKFKVVTGNLPESAYFAKRTELEERIRRGFQEQSHDVKIYAIDENTIELPAMVTTGYLDPSSASSNIIPMVDEITIYFSYNPVIGLTVSAVVTIIILAAAISFTSYQAKLALVEVRLMLTDISGAAVAVVKDTIREPRRILDMASGQVVPIIAIIIAVSLFLIPAMKGK